MSEPLSPWLTRVAVADRLGIKKGTLANLASERPPAGPPFWLVGTSPKYHVALADRWLVDRTSVPNGKQFGLLKRKTGHPSDQWLVSEDSLDLVEMSHYRLERVEPISAPLRLTPEEELQKKLDYRREKLAAIAASVEEWLSEHGI